MKTRLRILYLEDEPNDAELVQELLQAAGIENEIQRVETRAAFEAALQAKQPDLIFSDKLLPAFDGLSALALAREKLPDTPFIFISGRLGEEEAIESLKSGATDYVLKRRLERLVPVIERALRDMAERKMRAQAEAALAASENRLRALIEHSADGITIHRADGTLAFASPAAFRITGRKEGDAEPNIFDVTHPQDRARVARLRDNVLANPEKLFTEQFRIRRRDGAWRWIEADVQNLAATPSIQGIVSNFRDITVRKQAEEQLEQHLKRLAALRSVDTAISANIDLTLTMNLLLAQVARQLRVDAADILLWNPAAQKYEYGAGHGFRTDTIERATIQHGVGIAGRAALTGRISHVPDLRDSNFLRAGLFVAEEFIAYICAPLAAKGQNKGVLEIFHRAPLEPDEEWMQLFKAFSAQAAIAIDNAQLFDKLQRSNLELSLAYETTIEGWSRALDLRDKGTEGHTRRVTEITMRLAKEFEIPAAQLIHIRRGALLHDIGKMGVPDNILLKPGPLTQAEWQVMRNHPVYAYELLSPITFLRPALEIPYAHHEKWDGSGYPRGLKGEEIPLAARIFAVADVWDALRSERPYRRAWGEAQVRAHLKAQSEIQFDPRVVQVFLQLQTEDIL